MVLGYLWDYPLAEKVRLGKGVDLSAYKGTELLMASGITGFIFSLLGLYLAVLICQRNKWHLLNAILPIIPILILSQLNLKIISIIRGIIRTPGTIFDGWAYYLFNGVVCVLIGVVILRQTWAMKNHNQIQKGRAEFQSA
jgi:hypothetical protein